MARRPKRSLEEEIARHREIVAGLRSSCSALAGLYPDVPEFGYAARILKDGDELLATKATPTPLLTETQA